MLQCASSLFAQGTELPPPVRIDSGVSGHIHPALCITKKGTLVAVYCKSEYKPYLITRSTDDGKTFKDVKPFPDVSSQGWRQEMIALKNGWLLASQIVGPGVGGEKIQFIVSRDDGQSWDLDHPIEFYNPGRAIGGRACPRTVEIDAATLGTIFYDIDAKQPGGAGVFFRTHPRSALAR